MSRKLLWAGVSFWLLLTAWLLWRAPSGVLAAEADSGRELTVKELREALAAHPDVLLDVLRENSETLLDIVQEGAILRRNKGLVAAWKNDLKVPKSINLDRRVVLGAADAPVTVVAYSDFTCPYCEQSAQTMKELFKEFDGKIRYVFKSFPLGEHGNGRLAGEYFVAAGLQNPEKAWKFYDLLFSRRESLIKEGEPVLKKTAEEAGLDMKRLAADVKAKTVRGMVDEDLAEGTRLGVDGTPTFFVNNLVVRGALARELFGKAINMALDDVAAKKK